MNKEEKIQQEIQKTIDCFDQAEPIKADSFFYTRLKAKMNRQTKTSWQWQARQWKSVWGILKPALLVWIVAVNIVTAVVFFTGQNSSQNSRAQLLNEFARETMLDSNQFNPNLLTINLE